MPSHDAVVRNTFLHILGDESNSGDELVYLGKSERREKSEPATRSRSLYASGDSMCSTTLGSRGSETQEEKTNESDSSGHRTLRWKVGEFSKESQPSSSETREEKSNESDSNEPRTLRWKEGELSTETQLSTSEALSTAVGEQRRSNGADRDRVEWDDSIVTVMVRQIPRQFTQSMFLKLVNRRGFRGRFNFLYLPFDYKKGINVGYGFVNLVKPEYARAFHSALDGVYAAEKRSKMKGKPFHVHPAAVQGYEANWQHFMQTKVGQNPDPHFSPLFFPEAGMLENGTETPLVATRMKVGTGKHSKRRDCAESPPGQWQGGWSSSRPCPHRNVEHDLNHRYCVQCGMMLSSKPQEEVEQERRDLPVTERLMHSIQ